MTSLLAVSRESTRPLPFSTTIESGVTEPLTTDSPNPHAALIVASFRRPFEGLAVNITPAASDSTILWTTTARLTVAGSTPWRSWYAIARADHREAQQFLTPSSSASPPRTFR